MRKRLSKPKRQATADDFGIPARVADSAVRQHLDGSPAEDPDAGKNPHAVALGRIGGLKGGPARAEKLSATKRKRIARHAALQRWGKL